MKREEGERIGKGRSGEKEGWRLEEGGNGRKNKRRYIKGKEEGEKDRKMKQFPHVPLSYPDLISVSGILDIYSI